MRLLASSLPQNYNGSNLAAIMKRNGGVGGSVTKTQVYSEKINVVYSAKMADNDIDLYADDIDQDFAQDDFGGDNVDLYDDVISAPAGTNNTDGANDNHQPARAPSANEETAGNLPSTNQNATSAAPTGRKHQLYVGNLTWWTTDQDIANAVRDIGVKDFHEVKFFEHRANGQSKGFCVVSLGSQPSMRLCLELLPKKEINGQAPAVTPPTKQALSNFESQSKTRPQPPNNPNSRPPHPSQQHPNSNVHHHSGGPMMQGGGGGGGGGGQYGGQRMPPMNHHPHHQGMRPPVMQPPGGVRMQGLPGFNGPPQMNHQQGQPRFQGGPPPQWNGPRPNGPMPGPNMGGMRPVGPPPGAQGPPRPPMQFQGPPQGQGGPMPRGPMPGQQGPPPPMRPDWSRPPMQQGGGNFPPHQGPPQMGPRGPPPPMGPPGSGPHQGPPGGGPAPHVNPAFFQQGGGGPPPPMQHMAGPGPVMPPQGPPQGPPHGPPMGPGGGALPPPHGYGPPTAMTQPPYAPSPGGPPPPDHHRGDVVPQLSEQEFEDIMSRNRTVSSSAIGRAVSDAAAGEYASAIETLVTAISLIKQSKVANDDRCKILISSLQDTLRGVEDKSYSSSRRDRSRSRDRSHRRGRRERSSSRYRDRSRERERERDRDRERERDRYYADYRERDRERERSRSRDRSDRDRERDYRERETEETQSVNRPTTGSRTRNKSPVDPVEASGDPPSKSRYYDERYRERERESGRRGGGGGDGERERDRDRRGEDGHRSRH